MDNGFKIGAETRIHGNVTIVNEKSSWIPNFSDYLFVKIIFMKKFYCKDYIILYNIIASRRNVVFLIHTVT